MLPLRIVETDRPEFDEPVVELWRDEEFIGMVFWDGEESIVQIYPDRYGDVFDLELGDLMRALDMAIRIVTPLDQFSEDETEGSFLQEYNAGAPEGEWDEESPATRSFTDEFDSQVVFRAEDGEGFYDGATALEMVARCEQLGLAVVEIDAFDLEGSVLIPRPELGVFVDAPAGMDFSVRAAAANAQVRAGLEAWPSRSSLVAALVIQQPDGESFVA
ncbi:MAG: hypothetical protein QNJ75_02375 [Acidimicrobiia bacterium]|nr:hypothetical protein [Acidimicrobiia bacterium]